MVWSALFCFSASASSLGVRHTPSWCPKPFTLPVCRSCGSPSLLGVLSSLPFHDQTGVRPGWQLWLLGDGRGASRKIFALWYCLKTELFMVFVVLVAMQIQIKRVLFFWMLLIHAFFSLCFPCLSLTGYFCELCLSWLWGWSCLANWQWCSWCDLCHFLVQRAWTKYMRNFLEPTPTPSREFIAEIWAFSKAG